MRGVVCGNCKMARNSEKRLSGLNRFLEAKETGEYSINYTLTILTQSTIHREELKAKATSISELYKATLCLHVVEGS